MTDTTKRIVYVDDDGIVNVVVPSPNCDLTIEQVQAKDVPSGIESWIVEESTIPRDRSFRNAWTFTP